MKTEIMEVELNDAVCARLIELSQAWADEDSSYGYVANTRADIEGHRIFVAREQGEIIGYLLSSMRVAHNINSIIPDGTEYFEVDELYVAAEHRGSGVGAALFECAQSAASRVAEYMMLGTASKNWRAVLHFYIDRMGMDCWSARLFKRLRRDGVNAPAEQR